MQTITSQFSNATAMTITLASLASSTAGVGRQSDFVDNAAGHREVLLFVRVRQGTSPTGNRGVYIHLLRDDGDASTPQRTDDAGADDAAITIGNAELVGVLQNGGSPSTGDDLVGSFLIHQPGPKWAIAIVHDTGAALDGTGGNHVVRFVGIDAEVASS